MVKLGGLLSLYVRQRITRGPAAVKDLLPLTILNRKKKRIRVPAPGFKCRYHSVLLGRELRLRVTLATKRAIENIGGFDRYIYYTPEEQLKSIVALSLRRRMQTLVAKHPSVEPPPLDKRKPKPLPKKLPVDVKPIEVCDMNKYLYLG